MKSISDVELISSLCDNSYVSNAYKKAIGSMINNPEFSILKFRQILEWMIIYLYEREDHYIEDFKKFKLADQINTLFDEGIISFNQKDSAHSIRISANRNVHRENHSEDIDDIIIADCKNIRKEITSILCEHYEIEHRIPYGKLRVTFEKIEDIDIRELIFNGVFSDDYSFTLEAAIYCETYYKKQLCKHTTTESLHNHKEWVFQETMPDIILSLYKSAVFNSSTLDKHCGNIAIEDPSYEALESSDPECLYRYAMFLLEYYDKETLVPRLNETTPLDLLKTAAYNGSLDAESKLGELEIEDGHIERGLETLNFCMSKGSISAILALAQF